MKTLALVVAVLCGCVDGEGEPSPSPDASVQAVETPDACVREPSGDCCALLPDDSAVRECAAATTAPGACGVLVCWSADCVQTKLNFCAPD